MLCHAILVCTIHCITEMISTNCGMPGDLTDEASWFLTSLPLSQLCQPDCKEAIYHQFIIKKHSLTKMFQEE